MRTAMLLNDDDEFGMATTVRCFSWIEEEQDNYESTPRVQEQVWSRSINGSSVFGTRVAIQCSSLSAPYSVSQQGSTVSYPTSSTHLQVTMR